MRRVWRLFADERTQIAVMAGVSLLVVVAQVSTAYPELGSDLAYRFRLWRAYKRDSGINWSRLAAIRDVLAVRYADDCVAEGSAETGTGAGSGE